MSKQPSVVLTIAGSDSSGGAGLQADLRTFAALGVYGACAVTLVSSQNTAEFRSVVAMPPEMLLSQIEAVLDDLPVAATKTGMLFTEANINAVATIAERGRLPLLVVDPVLVGMKGLSLYAVAVERLVAQRLAPQAKVITPNHIEAGLLLGRTVVDDTAAVVDAAHELAALGPEVVVVTGGRRSGPQMEDVVLISGEVHLLESARIDTVNVRGSGDTLSAAIAAHLAMGSSSIDAVRLAHTFTSGALVRGADWRLGSGQGPVGPSRG